jgi:hypothetical protein
VSVGEVPLAVGRAGWPPVRGGLNVARASEHGTCPLPAPGVPRPTRFENACRARRYTARVIRRDGNATLQGIPRYAGPTADDAARSGALDEAVAPLLELATSLRADAQALTSSASSTAAWGRRQARTGASLASGRLRARRALT